MKNRMGAIIKTSGVDFSVWAPNASFVSVIGDFNNWDKKLNPMTKNSHGIWSCFVANIKKGAKYKYYVFNEKTGHESEKADPYARFSEIRPQNASVVWNDDYCWQDQKWLSSRFTAHNLQSPISIYELHLGSWKKKDGRSLTYLELCQELPSYIKKLGFTHVEFMPLTEFPYDPSWGYQTTGYFAITSRFGTPSEFKSLVDSLHQENIGVILDWVPAHFPTDSHGLGLFDGTHLYEHPDKNKGYHPDWKTYIFNFGQPEIKQFLIDSALYLLEEFHIDGLRVDAVASMIYLDYSREYGKWSPNEFGGNLNLEAIEFIKELNHAVKSFSPDILMIAEESTAYPGVTAKDSLGFDLKWDMGWMHDTLAYLKYDSIHRKHHHDEITFRMVYAFKEKYCLALSHDEVVHGKGSLLARMPGDDWQRFANQRILFAYMYTMPGKKLIFMGNELASSKEWNFSTQCEWDKLSQLNHYGIYSLIAELNRIYQIESQVLANDFHESCFLYTVIDDSTHSIIAFERSSLDGHHKILTLINFTEAVHIDYVVGVTEAGIWHRILNSDEKKFGGSDYQIPEKIKSQTKSSHNQSQSIKLIAPPLAVISYKWQKA